MKTVLFVGVQNAGRSQIAEAFFNHFARERGLHYRAESAGIQPGFALNLSAEDVMSELRIPLTGHRPKPVTAPSSDSTVRVILVSNSIDPATIPASDPRTVEKWDIEDIKGLPVEEVRDIRSEIRWKVEDLLTDLGRHPVGTDSARDDAETPAEEDTVNQPVLRRDLAAFDVEQKLRYTFLIEHLKRAVQARESHANGCAVALLSDTSTCLQTMEFITMERLCCPFLSFRLEMGQDTGLLMLTLTGPEGAGELLADFLPHHR